MGKKYIIEIIEKPFKDDAGREVWRAKGFNTLYFDQNGLDKLEEYKESKHEFIPGDVCRWKEVLFTRNNKVYITRITNEYVQFLSKTGEVGSMLRGVFEKSADFVYHANLFEALSEE